MQPTPDLDLYAWSIESAARLRGGRVAEVDLGRVAEELEDMGKRQKQALGSHLKVLMRHLLKWHYQPGFRGVSWRLSITNARDEIAELLEDSPSLAPRLAEIRARRYPSARARAALETGLPIELFPTECPFSVEQLLDPDYWVD
ncbi:MAG TPA: DUF29 domain-containing protein [Lamprocystis sp. (in: g-proteobacteria)]|nr:DUF29 domain-containing protein [Lamprocystis sp. (in: g-proteobacteria)]